MRHVSMFVRGVPGAALGADTPIDRRSWRLVILVQGVAMDSSEIRVGRLPNCSVRAWLEEHQVTVARLPFILISTIDSNRRVVDMPWAVAKGRSDPGWALSTSPLVISGSSTVDLLDQNLFTGFDELWVPAQMPVTDPPDDANLVAPRALDAVSYTHLRAHETGRNLV